MTSPKTSYSAFQDLLKTLCLHEFPCGFGTWRNPNDKFAQGRYAVTMKDYGIQYEKMEVLEEYLKSGTWDSDTSWSKDAASLRSLAVTEPWKLSLDAKGIKFVHSYFKSLRLIDKEITDVDGEMLRLKNLEELTLSVNFLEEISSTKLPTKLKVLELCSNCIQSIASLCKKPPPLQHLGLSDNRLCNVDEYKFFTGYYWPSLLSLDLSNNNLAELVVLVEYLVTLPNLKNLLLQGNPFSVIPGYRGHIVDALKGLTLLDDVIVSADEKHHFKGLGKKKELIEDEAYLTVAVDNLSGIPIPEELKDNEEREEFPVVTTEYIVEYLMLKDVLPQTAQTSRNEVASSLIQQPTQSTEKVLQPTEIVVHTSELKEWEETAISMDFQKTHTVEDLLTFRDFLVHGVNFKILSKRTLSWPLTLAEGENANVQQAQRKKSPKDGKESPSKKAKDAKGKDAAKSAKSDKGKKKTTPKKPEEELRSDPPIYSEVGSCHIALQSFLEGEKTVEKLCYCGGGPMPTTQSQLPKVTIQDRPKTPTKSRGKSPKGKASPAKGKTPSADKSKGKPGSAGKKNNKKQDQDSVSDSEEPQVPPPITLQVKVELRKWNTAADSLKHI